MGSRFSSKKALSAEDMQFLKAHTKYDEKTIQEWYTGFKADCPTGKVSKKKFIEMYKTFFSLGNPQKFCEHVFRTFDTDGNGYIDFKEFLLAIAVTSSGTVQERLNWAFRMYDIDGDGTIEVKEMKGIVQSLYDMVGPCIDDMPAETAEQRTVKIFQKMDSDKDGRLTREEFITGCMEDPQLMKMLHVNILNK